MAWPLGVGHALQQPAHLQSLLQFAIPGRHPTAQVLEFPLMGKVTVEVLEFLDVAVIAGGIAGGRDRGELLQALEGRGRLLLFDVGQVHAGVATGNLGLTPSPSQQTVSVAAIAGVGPTEAHSLATRQGALDNIGEGGLVRPAGRRLRLGWAGDPAGPRDGARRLALRLRRRLAFGGGPATPGRRCGTVAVRRG